MLSPDYIIDAVQNNKKFIVNTFVYNNALKQDLVELIEAQTRFNKSLARTALTLSQTFISSFSPKDTQ